MGLLRVSHIIGCCVQNASILHSGLYSCLLTCFHVSSILTGSPGARQVSLLLEIVQFGEAFNDCCRGELLHSSPVRCPFPCQNGSPRLFHFTVGKAFENTEVNKRHWQAREPTSIIKSPLLPQLLHLSFTSLLSAKMTTKFLLDFVHRHPFPSSTAASSYHRSLNKLYHSMTPRSCLLLRLPSSVSHRRSSRLHLHCLQTGCNH